MENNAMQLPLWFQIIAVIVCVGLIVLVAAWSVISDWIVERSKALLNKMLSAAAKCNPRFVFAVTKNAAKLGHYMNSHLHIRPRHT